MLRAFYRVEKPPADAAGCDDLSGSITCQTTEELRHDLNQPADAGPLGQSAVRFAMGYHVSCNSAICFTPNRRLPVQ